MSIISNNKVVGTTHHNQDLVKTGPFSRLRSTAFDCTSWSFGSCG